MTASGFAYALAAGIIPSLIWLFFWTREDRRQPEPRWLLAGCFMVGMLVVILAIPLEQFAANMVADTSTRYMWWALIEEILKFLVVAAVALHSRYNDEPVDAMVYSVTVALGFAALENTLFIMGPLSTGNIISSIVTGNMRFIGATLVHVVSSGMLGFALGLTFYRGKLAKIATWLVALAVAVVVHSAFNVAIANASSMDALKTFAWVWGAVVIMIVLFEEVKAVRPRLVSPAVSPGH